jgi:hypothetical protein
MCRRILAACAVPILALLLRSAPALAQGVAPSVTLPDLSRLPEVAPPPDSTEAAGTLRADDPRSPRRANALLADYPLRPGMHLRIPS